MGERPIAKKYREGKMKRTLKRELKVHEVVKRESIGFSAFITKIQRLVYSSWSLLSNQSVLV